MPIPSAKLEDARTDNALLLLIRAYMQRSQTMESFEFYYSKESNEAQYNRYIREGAPDQVNIDAATRRPLDELATAGQYDRMGPGLKKAKDAVAEMVNNDVLERFSGTPEYKRWWVAKNKKNTDAGLKAVTELTKILKDSKQAATLRQLMLVVEGGRTPADRKQAYTAIVGLVKTPAKVPTIFKAASVEVPR